MGVLVLLFLKPEQKSAARWVALIAALITFGISIAILVQFNPADPALQMVVNVPWTHVGSYTISFALGVNGLSILMVLLTALLIPISILSAW